MNDQQQAGLIGQTAYRCIAPLCKPLGCCDCNCAVPADVYAVLMRAERSDLGEAAARDQMQRANLAGLANENDELRKDAERYRWLANDIDGNAQDDFVRWLGMNVWPRTEIDVVIDAAMAEQARRAEAKTGGA